MTPRARRFVGAWAAAAFLALAVACASVRVPPPPDPPALVAGVAACHDAAGTFVARFRVHAKDPGGTVAARGWIAVRFPASVRVEIQDPLGRPMVFVVLDGGVLRVLDAANATYTEAPATPASLARWLRVPLDPEWAAKVLTGLVLRGGGWTAGAGDSGGLPVVHADGRWRAVLDPSSGAVRRAERRAGGATDLVVTYEGAGRGVPCDRPTAFTAAVVASGTETDMIYASIEWDQPLPEGVFLLPVPDGARVERVP